MIEVTVRKETKTSLQDLQTVYAVGELKREFVQDSREIQRTALHRWDVSV